MRIDWLQVDLSRAEFRPDGFQAFGRSLRPSRMIGWGLIWRPSRKEMRVAGVLDQCCPRGQRRLLEVLGLLEDHFHGDGDARSADWALCREDVDPRPVWRPSHNWQLVPSQSFDESKLVDLPRQEAMRTSADSQNWYWWLSDGMQRLKWPWKLNGKTLKITVGELAEKDSLILGELDELLLEALTKAELWASILQKGACWNWDLLEAKHAEDKRRPRDPKKEVRREGSSEKESEWANGYFDILSDQSEQSVTRTMMLA
jgi:hypothetical protein